MAVYSSMVLIHLLIEELEEFDSSEGLLANQSDAPRGGTSLFFATQSWEVF